MSCRIVFQQSVWSVFFILHLSLSFNFSFTRKPVLRLKAPTVHSVQPKEILDYNGNYVTEKTEKTDDSGKVTKLTDSFLTSKSNLLTLEPNFQFPSPDHFASIVLRSVFTADHRQARSVSSVLVSTIVLRLNLVFDRYLDS